MTRPIRTRLAFTLCLAALALAGCDASAPPQEQTDKAPAAFGQDHTAEIDWLKGNDGTDPGWWLASREAERDPGVDREKAAGELRRLLAETRQNFMETPRMIANRAVQLEATLAERGVHESARELLVGFNATKNPNISSRRFGEICQYYANLRQEGLDRQAALKALSSPDHAQKQP